MFDLHILLVFLLQEFRREDFEGKRINPDFIIIESNFDEALLSLNKCGEFAFNFVFTVKLTALNG